MTVYTLSEYLTLEESKSSEWISKKSYDKSVKTNELWQIQLSCDAHSFGFKKFYGDNLEDLLEYLNERFPSTEGQKDKISFHNEKPRLKRKSCKKKDAKMKSSLMT